MAATIILAILAFATELLKTINAAQAGKPADQVRAEGIIAWGIFSKILNILLPADIKQKLTDEGVHLDSITTQLSAVGEEKKAA